MNLFIPILIKGQKGGFQPMNDPNRISVLESKLDQHMTTAFNDPGAKLQNIIKAESQRVNGINYHILAQVLVNGKTQKCCFAVYESFFGPFEVNCAQCGQCTCFGAIAQQCNQPIN